MTSLRFFIVHNRHVSCVRRLRRWKIEDDDLVSSWGHRGAIGAGSR